ncbi:MAG: AsmA family protein [Kiritimatiellae bacterium]|nr:AsmA family protein [Kiritimatiellia bacterium]
MSESAKKSHPVRNTFVVIVCILVGLVLFAEYGLDRTVRVAFNKAAPGFLGVKDASVEDIDVSLFRDPTLSLVGLHIGNPEGFATPSLFDLDNVVVDLDMKSLFSDTIVVNRVLVESASLTYEQRLSSNIGTLLEKFESDAEKEEEEKDSAPSKKVIIRDLQVNGTSVNLAVAGTMGHSATIPLPSVHLTDIGAPKDDSDSSGVSFVDATVEILKAILGAVTGVVGNVAGLAVDAVSAVGSGVADAATATASAVADGATAAASAVADGAKALVGLLPFGGSGDDAPAPDAPADE